MLKYFTKLRQVVMEMEKEEVVIYPCYVSYKSTKYIVLIERILDDTNNSDIAKLIFMDADNLSDKLAVMVNDYSFSSATTKEIRIFFNIPYEDGKLGTLFQNLYMSLSSQFPNHYFPNYKNQKSLRQIVLDEIGSNSPANADKKYCHHIKRLGVTANGNHMRRSAYNSQKTQLLRPSLFNYFCKDKSLSFCFYDDPNMERNDTQIINYFSSNKGINV